MVNIYFYPSVRAAQASHTRLCQLSDLSFAYPSLNLRSTFVTYSAVPARRLSFAQGSLGEILNFEF